ncbi:aminotransferase class V-fold PLP-dependent enzyme [Hirschia baltica]|uniref:Cysteine desulfurase n=1 Tax=Hirschia baltica (strain ATCC 49814 / DSM 5838 / IFAM 1418) TaxID=582402 RepID=C6XJ41_HIRBI|nr:cysteine desulfurase [Hirschia baltica]ACT59136.1 cysteine desulfurase, SufS subfamily [Hirschia baltica ATCC 49814]
MADEVSLKSEFDIQNIREQFPILERKIGNKPLIYLDSAASAQKSDYVLDAMFNQARTAYSNVHRGLHTLANETTDAFEKSRELVRSHLNAKSVDEIIFTKGATEAINLVASGLGATIKAGDEIMVSVMEHHSNIVPWHFLRERFGAVIKWIEIEEDGSLDMESFRSQLSEKTRLVAVTHMSNVLGTVPDVKTIIKEAHSAGALVLLDGCQAAVHLDVDVQVMDVDFYVCSAHKMYGPTGIGALYGKLDILANMQPYQGGGEMIDLVTRESVTYNTPPHRFEAGTPAILEAVGFGAAVAWMQKFVTPEARAYKKAVYERLAEGVRGINGLTIYGMSKDKGPVLTFSIEGTHPHDLAQILDRYGVAIRAGHHCAQPLMSHLKVSATARASVGVYNTLEEADMFVEALDKARAMLLA